MQYDAFSFKGSEVQLLVDVQSDIIDIPGYRVVAPLIPEDRFSSQINITLFPRLLVNGELYRIHPNQMASVPERILTEKICSLASSSDAINNAINMLFLGI